MIFTEDEYDDHSYLALQIYQNFNSQLKEIIYDPTKKNFRVKHDRCLFFDMHTKRNKRSDPHVVIWFRSENNKRHIEIAINSENKLSNHLIKKKIGEYRFWETLKKASKYNLKLYNKNVYINKRGFIYPISSRHYEWIEPPIINIKSNKIYSDNRENINLWLNKLNEFDSDNYKPNNYKRGQPWCNNAIFAFCIVKEYGYNLKQYKEYAEEFNELSEFYSYLLEK